MRAWCECVRGRNRRSQRRPVSVHVRNVGMDQCQSTYVTGKWSVHPRRRPAPHVTTWRPSTAAWRGEGSPRRRPTSPTRHDLAADEANTNHPQRSGADERAHAGSGNKPPKLRPRAPPPQQKKQGRARRGRATATGENRSRVLPLLCYFPPPVSWPEG